MVISWKSSSKERIYFWKAFSLAKGERERVSEKPREIVDPIKSAM